MFPKVQNVSSLSSFPLIEGMPVALAQLLLLIK